MKDAYSFHIDEASLNQGYVAMYDAYVRIFTRLGLKFRAVQADGGSIGGSVSQEFHVLAESGEDAIAFSDTDAYAANLELAAAAPPAAPRPAPSRTLERVSTPKVRSIADLCAFLGVAPAQCVKTLLVEGSNNDVVALVIRGDHDLNAVKSQRLPGVANPLRMAGAERVRAATGAEPGSLGPIGFSGKLYVDHSAAQIADFICGANEREVHFVGANWGRDLPDVSSVDIRNAVAGDPSPSGTGTLEIARGIEVGHIFQLGQLYSAAMQATVLDEQSQAATMYMGCYGIGVTRVVAAAIEQNHDDNGIIWPEAIAPFRVALVPLNYQKSAQVQSIADRLYEEFAAAGMDVLLDDRDARPGVKFADSELFGIPHRLVIGERGLAAGKLEYRHRRDTAAVEIPMAEAMTHVLQNADR
jgi:prolyl-tRNA synthetase